jgi:hypothetical protein
VEKEDSPAGGRDVLEKREEGGVGWAADGLIAFESLLSNSPCSNSFIMTRLKAIGASDSGDCALAAYLNGSGAGKCAKGRDYGFAGPPERARYQESILSSSGTGSLLYQAAPMTKAEVEEDFLLHNHAERKR